MEKLIIILLYIGFAFSNTTEFIVSFMSMNTAIVKITEKDTLFNEKKAISIVYETETISNAKVFFPVHNYYQTIIDKNFKMILEYKKSTSQPWLNNNLATHRIGEKIFYRNSSISIPTDFHNIFTLLQYLNHKKIKNIINKTYHLDREGQKYKAFFKIKNEDIENDIIELSLHLELIKNNNHQLIIENTDIFTWAIFKENSERILKIKNGKLIYCEFSTGFITMKANLVDK